MFLGLHWFDDYMFLRFGQDTVIFIKSKLVNTNLNLTYKQCQIWFPSQNNIIFSYCAKIILLVEHVNKNFSTEDWEAFFSMPTQISAQTSAQRRPKLQLLPSSENKSLISRSRNIGCKFLCIVRQSEREPACKLLRNFYFNGGIFLIGSFIN